MVLAAMQNMFNEHTRARKTGVRQPGLLAVQWQKGQWSARGASPANLQGWNARTGATGCAMAERPVVCSRVVANNADEAAGRSPIGVISKFRIFHGHRLCLGIVFGVQMYRCLASLSRGVWKCMHACRAKHVVLHIVSCVHGTVRAQFWL